MTTRLAPTTRLVAAKRIDHPIPRQKRCEAPIKPTENKRNALYSDSDPGEMSYYTSFVVVA